MKIIQCPLKSFPTRGHQRVEKLKSHKKKCPQRQVVSKGRGMEVDDFLYDMFLDSSTVYVSAIWGFDMKGSSDGFSPLSA